MMKSAFILIKKTRSTIMLQGFKMSIYSN